MKQPFRETHNMFTQNLHARFSIWVISRPKSQLGHAWNQGMEFKMSNFHYSCASMIKKYPHWPLILHVKYKQQQWFILQNHQASF